MKPTHLAYNEAENWFDIKIPYESDLYYDEDQYKTRNFYKSAYKIKFNKLIKQQKKTNKKISNEKTI